MISPSEFKPKAAERALAENLMLAPVVVAIRLPMLMAEALGNNPWRVETTRATVEKAWAIAEGMVAAQIFLGTTFWHALADLATGRAIPPTASGKAARELAKVAFTPAGKAVQRNYRRLSGGS